MVKKEKTNKRDLEYSKWHRTISHKCYAINIDWCEYRRKNGIWQIVALIEDKDDQILQVNLDQWYEKQMPVYLILAEKLNCPAYLVLHNLSYVERIENGRFIVEDCKTRMKKILDINQYTKFLEEL